jgi:hypothetical protein
MGHLRIGKRPGPQGLSASSSPSFAGITIGGILTTGVRQKLAANASYYVRTDGSDSNDGSANNSGHAWLTIQHGIDYIREFIDPAGHDVTIYVADGTYSADYPIILMNSIPHMGKFSIIGNSTNPENVVISAVYDCIAVFGWWNGKIALDAKGQLYFGGMKLVAGIGNRPCIYAESSWVTFGNIDFGASNYTHIRSVRGSVVYAVEDYKISADAPMHMDAEYFGQIIPFSPPVTVTIVGTRNFSSGFAYVATNGIVDTTGTIWSGSATGVRYVSDKNSTIWTGDGSELSLPGNAAGIKAAGGTYNGYPEREILRAARTYYVRTDGNDTNNGLANTAAGAFLTIQAAVNKILSSLDFDGYDVTIQVGDGTYTAGAVVRGYTTNIGRLTIKGNTGTPANVLINLTSADGFHAVDNYDCPVNVKDMKIVTGTSGTALRATNGILRFANIEFGAAATYHLYALNGGIIEATGNYAVSGGALAHGYANNCGKIFLSGRTITFSNTPAFSSWTFGSRTGSTITASSMTFTNGNTVTGTRYYVDKVSLIDSDGGGDNYLPGNAGGSFATGGVYS